ncbi:mandelate racemase/muconate lactonizing enzyme family protein [Maribacter sp. Asnod2-G09]|uniref:mandelate racemase/muconate lactonizing enzyme family protein n=1 Tax=Maribacter sp. Asnod2-G09 TaxID=3160577 RepID=UPI0038659819
MISRRNLLRTASLTPLAALTPLTGIFANTINEERRRGVKPILKITDVETFIVRSPNDDAKPDELIDMPPIGFMKGKPGVGHRLDHASPSRPKGHTQTLLVKIHTDQGIIGWGECHAPTAPRVHQRVISDLLRPILLGQDALNILPLWEKMYSSERMRGHSTGYFTTAIAGIDIALWDILGKYLDTPVYQLLGGKFRSTIPTYTSGKTPEEAAEAIKLGFTGIKTGFGKGSTADDMERIRAMSKAVGTKGQLFIDSLGAFNLSEAILVGRKFDEMGNIAWFEDALLPEEYDKYPILAEAIDTPICVGETYSNRFQFRDLLIKNGADAINPDLGRAGGITECKRIADLADSLGVLWSAHVSSGFPPYVAASIHLMVATPNAAMIEGGNIAGNTSAFGSRGNILLKNPIKYEPGYAHVPEGPGLGIEFDEFKLKELIVRE